MRSRIALVLWLAVTGCRGLLGIEEPVVGDGALPGDDAPIADAPDLLVDANPCTGTFATFCLDMLPTEDRELEGVIDTDASPLCTTTTPAVAGCVVAGRGIVVESGKTLRAVGSRPLVLVATQGSLQIAGTVDVASREAELGAGANPPAGCQPPPPPSGRSGPAGGSFGGRGGNGGEGVTGQAGVASPPLVTLASLRGGCAGGRGSSPSSGLGGAGGGAIWLVGPAIDISSTGRINASGAGGAGGGTNDSAGGGGGSGGAIVLDAATITIAGEVFANGGGGGEGGGNTLVGVAGAAPTSATLAAPGGSGGTAAGGNGGAGSLGGDGGLAVDTMDGGGGGGGGGAGFILASPNRNVTGAVSPAARDL